MKTLSLFPPYRKWRLIQWQMFRMSPGVCFLLNSVSQRPVTAKKKQSDMELPCDYFHLGEKLHLSHQFKLLKLTTIFLDFVQYGHTTHHILMQSYIHRCRLPSPAYTSQPHPLLITTSLNKVCHRGHEKPWLMNAVGLNTCLIMFSKYEHKTDRGCAAHVALSQPLRTVGLKLNNKSVTR